MTSGRRPFRTRSPLAALAAAVWAGTSCLAAGCGGGDTGTTPPRPAAPKPAATSFGSYAFRDTIGTIHPDVPVLVTDAAGIARTLWQLGLTAGPQVLVASVAGSAGLTATANATVSTGFATRIASAPAQVVLGVAGDTAHVIPITTDRGGNRFRGLSVQWSTAAPLAYEAVAITGRGAGATTVTARIGGTGAAGALPVTVANHTRVWSGYGRTCGTTAEGALSCWGDNTYGALGDGTTTRRQTPAPLLVGRAVVRVSIGPYRICALAATGEAFCTGFNGSGSKADGSVAPAGMLPAARELRFADLSTEQGTTCGVTAAGEAYCWGDTFPTPAHAAPTRFAPGVTLTGLAPAGSYGVCGLAEGGSVRCWGDGSNRFGDPPVTVPSAYAFTTLSVESSSGYASFGGDARRVCGAARGVGVVCESTGGRYAAAR